MKDSENPDFNEDFLPEYKTDRLRLYRNILLYAVLFPGIGLSLLYLGHDNAIYSPLIFVVTLIISLPLLYRVNSKYRKGELPYPNELEYKECRGTIKNQCNICQRHPISKKYHIENFHNKKNEKIEDYFVACGCLKCEKWDWRLAG
jgi:hypothetical protein